MICTLGSDDVELAPKQVGDVAEIKNALDERDRLLDGLVILKEGGRTNDTQGVS